LFIFRQKIVQAVERNRYAVLRQVYQLCVFNSRNTR
jgi:hypothetical protein